MAEQMQGRLNEAVGPSGSGNTNVGAVALLSTSDLHDRLTVEVADLGLTDEVAARIADLLAELPVAVQRELEGEALRQTEHIERLAAEVLELKQTVRSQREAAARQAALKSNPALRLVGKRVRHKRTRAAGVVERVDTTAGDVHVVWSDGALGTGIAHANDLKVIGDAEAEA